MVHNVDIIIILSFLAINLLAGLYSGKNVKTIKEYAIGNRNFSTATIAATIIATWISGSFFTVCISQTYKEGVWFLPAALGDILSLLIIGYIFAPRMKEFFGSLSVAETMGNLYGSNVRLITAISSIAQAIAMTALQIKVFATVFSYFLEVSSIYATCISSFVVIFYSAWGGIRAVTFTDVIQFFTFGIFIPLFLLFIWQVFGDTEIMFNSFQTNPLLDYKQLIDWHDEKFFPNLILLFWFLIPSFSSPTFQRILMTKDIKQTHQSFKLAALGYTFIILFICAIGILVLSINPNLEGDNIVMYMIDNYSFTGLKGITLIGIMAMVMSTADSWINTGAVIFAHDFCKPLGIKLKSELFLSRMFSIFVGIGALLIVLFNNNLFKLFSLQANFYMPIVTVPLILAILGFRTTSRSVILGMASGALCAIIWTLYIKAVTGVDSVIPAMICNLIVLISSHYLLQQPGGWVGIKDKSDFKKLMLSRQNSKFNVKQFLRCIYQTNVVEYYKNKTPKNDTVYGYFAFSMMITIITTFSLDKSIYNQHMVLVNILQSTSLFISTIFICHKLWSPNFKEKYIGLIFFISVFVGLGFVSSFLALISKFSQISLVIFILNLTIIGILMSWQTTLVIIISSVSLSWFSYQFYIGTTPDIAIELYNLKLKIIYVLFLVSSFLLAFLKPKQEMHELSEQRADHLSEQVHDIDEELKKSVEVKNEFLRNLEHEARTPIVGITTMGQVLFENYDKLTDNQRRKGLEEIAKSSERLTSFVNNMIDLSRLLSVNYTLDKKEVDLSELVYTRLNYCKKLYLNDKELQFFTKIEDNIKVNCDEHYIKSTLDNLIINAIQYSKDGNITLELHKNYDSTEIDFRIQDEGVAIPQAELYDVFGAFIVSSRTKTIAGGRGIGLALCEKGIKAHGGKIWAESDGKKGSSFRFTLPINV
jgi:Na+/proline symporter/signal transduction histidine kinase